MIVFVCDCCGRKLPSKHKTGNLCLTRALGFLKTEERKYQLCTDCSTKIKAFFDKKEREFFDIKRENSDENNS